MKVGVAQTRPVKGDIEGNIAKHIRLVDIAVLNGAEVIIFPELSLTGYEPELAKELAINKEDNRLDCFQAISDMNGITIGVGAPTNGSMGICISMILFQPYKARENYSKKYLHKDEEPFFIGCQSSINTIGDRTKIALAICYELSVAEHTDDAFKSGAEIYIASVAKTQQGVEKAFENLSETANKYSMTVLMSNSIGPSDNFESAGKTSIWNNEGTLVGQLNDTNEGIIMIDTVTQELVEKTM